MNLLRRIYLDADSDEDLFTGSAQIFRRRCDYLLQMLDVKHCPGVTPGGLRGGGAVAFYRKGGSVSELLWAMRLKQIATLESYLQEVAALSFCRSSPRTALLLYVLPLPFFLISTAEGFLQRFALCGCGAVPRLFWMWKGAAGFVTAFEATLDALEPPTPCRRSSLDGFLASTGAAWRWLCSLQRRWHISYMALWSMQKGIPASSHLQPEVEYNINIYIYLYI